MADSETRIVSLHCGYTTPGGEYVDGYIARPVDGEPRPGVVLLSGMFGLAWTQREITRIYARAGFVAISPDYLGGQRPQNREDALLVKNSLDVNRTVDALVGAADFLHSLPWVGPNGRIGIMGFCLGGGLVLLAAARTDKFHAGVVYHQSLFPDSRELQGITCRLQCHYGTDDHSTPREEVEAFTKALDQYGKDYELHWYEGQAHSFAQITPEADVPAAQRAATNLSQDRAFAFLHRELSQPTERMPTPVAAPTAAPVAAAVAESATAPVAAPEPERAPKARVLIEPA
jgi:carboxymethylenebutenolidase